MVEEREGRRGERKGMEESIWQLSSTCLGSKRGNMITHVEVILITKEVRLQFLYGDKHDNWQGD